MSVGGHKFAVELYNFLNHFFKKFGGQFRHHDTATSSLQTLGIGFYTENSHFAVFATMSLQALKSFLPVVKTCGSHVNVKGRFRRHLYLAPFSVAVIAAHIIIGWDVTEF